MKIALLDVRTVEEYDGELFTSHIPLKWCKVGGGQ